MKLATLSFALTTALCATALPACVGMEQSSDEVTETQEIFTVPGKTRLPGYCPTSPSEWKTREIYPLDKISIGTKLLDTDDVFQYAEAGSVPTKESAGLVAAVLLNLETDAFVSDEVLEAATEVDGWIVDVEAGGTSQPPQDATTILKDYFRDLRPCGATIEGAFEDRYVGRASAHPRSPTLIVP